MPLTKQGYWLPELSPKQLKVYNCNAETLLVCGPSLSGKSVAVQHKICRHLWETPMARVAMFSKTIKSAKDGGSWADLHNIIIPQWIKSGIGFDYTTLTADGEQGFKTDGATRTIFFRVRNRFGGESECMLFSLDFDDAIEDKIKEQSFSMIYFSELDKFRSRKVMSISSLRLRMAHLKMSQMQWLADTNPSEEGRESWIYEVFYRERVMTYPEYTEYMIKEQRCEPMSEPEFTNFKNSLQLIEIRPEENPYLEPRKLQKLKETYAYDEGLFSRYVKGEWVFGEGDASRHYRTLFKPQFHVLGNTDSPDEDEWELAVPSANCFELISGWDLGDVNHAAVILEKYYVNGKPCFVVLDELESIHEQIDLETFTISFLSLVEKLQATGKREFSLDKAWSDRSTIEQWSSAANTFPYMIVYGASEQRIKLQGLGRNQGKGNAAVRINMLKQLLFQNRIKISAHCTSVIRMLKDLKRGSGKLNVVPAADVNRHIHDALTYALMGELAEDYVTPGNHNVGKREKHIFVSV